MSARLTAVVVDDERLARAELRSLLSSHAELEVVGEAASASDGRELLERLRPDVVFLDIQMPGEDGFDLLATVPDSCRVVFVTAYSEHALRAFDANAADYLLKPVRPERLAETVQRLLKKPLELEPPAPRRALRLDDPLFVPCDGHYTVLRVAQIACLEAAKDSSQLTTTDGRKLMVTRSLKDWEETLPPRHFLRIHRSTIVNADHVERLEPWFHSSFRVYLKRVPEPFEVSRRFAAQLRDRLV